MGLTLLECPSNAKWKLLDRRLSSRAQSRWRYTTKRKPESFGICLCKHHFLQSVLAAFLQTWLLSHAGSVRLPQHKPSWWWNSPLSGTKWPSGGFRFVVGCLNRFLSGQLSSANASGSVFKKINLWQSFFLFYIYHSRDFHFHENKQHQHRDDTREHRDS